MGVNGLLNWWSPYWSWVKSWKYRFSSWIWRNKCDFWRALFVKKIQYFFNIPCNMRDLMSVANAWFAIFRANVRFDGHRKCENLIFRTNARFDGHRKCENLISRTKARFSIQRKKRKYEYFNSWELWRFIALSSFVEIPFFVKKFQNLWNIKNYGKIWTLAIQCSPFVPVLLIWKIWNMKYEIFYESCTSAIQCSQYISCSFFLNYF